MRFKRLKVPSKKATEYLKCDKELSQYWEQLNRDCYGEIIIDSDTLDHIGHVFVWHTKKNKGFIFNLEVKPQYRRQGYGWILLDDAVKKYDGIDLLVDEDNIPAIKLYEKYGFETIKTVNGQLWMKLNQIKQEGVIMFFDRLGNSVTGEPEIVEEPVVESYYDPNRPIRPGFEKPEMFQEGLFDAFKPTPAETFIEYLKEKFDNAPEDLFEFIKNHTRREEKFIININEKFNEVQYIGDTLQMIACIAGFDKTTNEKNIAERCKKTFPKFERDDYMVMGYAIPAYDSELYHDWDDNNIFDDNPPFTDRATVCFNNITGEVEFVNIHNMNSASYGNSKQRSVKEFMKCVTTADSKKRKDGTYYEFYNNMDLDEMSDYIQEQVITEANEASKKARKNAQEFMRDEYGTANPKSMTSKQRNRMKKWLKDNDYDPKTGTIATDMKFDDGKPIRVNLGTNSSVGNIIGQKSNMPFYAVSNPLYSKEKYTPAEQRVFAGGRDFINMPKEYMKRHPSVSTGISKHEEGHIADYRGKIDDVVDRRIEAGEHITQSMKKGMDYSPTHTNANEHIADLYSIQHNKYKDKLRFLNAMLSEDIHMQRKFKANWKDICENVYKKQSDDQPPIIDASSVETMRDSLKNLVSKTKANIKSYKAQLKTPMYPSGKNLLNRLIASGKDSCNEYEKILRKWFIGKLLFKKVDYDDAKVMVDKAVWHDAKNAVDEAIRQSDGDIEIRREFLKKYINEFAVEYDMSNVEVIQEMYQTAFEDYVFQEDYEEDEFVSHEIILEEKINAAERNELDDDDFGLVYTDEDGKKVRKYPLTDENHIRQAVRFFSHCPDEHKPQLARKILKKANEHDMDTSNWETIHEWAKK